MPPRVFPIVVLLGTATALAEESPAAGWREALAVEYELHPPPATAAVIESSPLRPGVPVPVFEDTDPEIVPLPAMTITARRAYRGLDQDFARAHALRQSRELTWKGGPLIERDLGPVHVGVYSILFVPVLFVGEVRW